MHSTDDNGVINFTVVLCNRNILLYLCYLRFIFLSWKFVICNLSLFFCLDNGCCLCYMVRNVLKVNCALIGSAVRKVQCGNIMHFNNVKDVGLMHVRFSS